MRTFINKKDGKRWIVLDNSVVEGKDAWFLKGYNISLPKAEYEEEKEDGKRSRR